jgi:hypothetical protein
VAKKAKKETAKKPAKKAEKKPVAKKTAPAPKKAAAPKVAAKAVPKVAKKAAATEKSSKKVQAPKKSAAPAKAAPAKVAKKAEKKSEPKKTAKLKSAKVAKVVEPKAPVAKVATAKSASKVPKKGEADPAPISAKTEKAGKAPKMEDESAGKLGKKESRAKRPSNAEIAKQAPIEEPVIEEAGFEADILTDAEGNRLCKVRDCDQTSTVEGFCRFHYILFWKNIQLRRKILEGDKLSRYINALCERYPDKFIDIIRRDLRTEKDFLTAIQEIGIDDPLQELNVEEDVFVAEDAGLTEDEF